MEALNTTLETVLIALTVICALWIIFMIFTWPIRIANRKNLTRNEITTITILTWCGLFAGITWFIALCLALSYKSND